MAKINKGILGAISGKLGPVIGATWKKIAYLRTPPKRSKKAGTPAQTANRKKFKFVAEWLVPFYPFVNVGFHNKAYDKTEINAAFSVNYREATFGVYPHLYIDYDRVVFSQGPLAKLKGVAVVLVGANTLSISWVKNDLRSTAAFNDQLMLILYNEELKMVDGFIGGVSRADLSCEFRFSPKLMGRAFHVYLGLYSVNGKMVSDSEYMGKVEGR